MAAFPHGWGQPTMAQGPAMVLPGASFGIGGAHHHAAAHGWSRGPCMAVPPNFGSFLLGHWVDSIGNSVIVMRSRSHQHELTAIITPLADHPDARDHVLTIRQHSNGQWRCGNSNLHYGEGKLQKMVCVTDDGRRCVWSRTAENKDVELITGGPFPWLLHKGIPEPWMPLDTPRDILYDAARVVAILDIRQIIGARDEPQERMTHILIDYDLQSDRQDYLIPSHDSPMWDQLKIPEDLRKAIRRRVKRIPQEAISQRLQWVSETEIWIGHHRITVSIKDIKTLESRWVLGQNDERKPLEIARLLALYSTLDTSLSNKRNGIHLGLDPEIRRQSDYELFASPLNAAVPNGCFASKWPHIEWRFGSMGSYPSVISSLPENSIVEINPPFTDVFLADVMSRVEELKLKFRVKIAVPIKDTPWRKTMNDHLPNPDLLKTYWDNSSETVVQTLHTTVYWEDPCCPKWEFDSARDLAEMSPMSMPQCQIDMSSQYVDMSPQWALAAGTMFHIGTKSEM